MVILPTMRLASFILFLFFAINAHAQYIKTDLSKQWLVSDGSQFIPVQDYDRKFQTIHFSIQPTEATGATIKIVYPEELAVFVNNKLIFSGKNEILTTTDSLRKLVNSQHIQLSVYHNNLQIDKLKTFLYSPHLITDSKTEKIIQPLVPTDFVILSAALIIVLLLTIILLNPKLASDYFSVSKLVSLREREESQVYNRIAGSTNFLFFGFSALTIALVLTLSKPFGSSVIFESANVKQYSWIWGGITGLLLVIVLIKMVATYFWAWLFNTREVAGLQFFNWIRAMFLLSGLSLLIITISLVVQFQEPMWISFWRNLLLFGLIVWNIPVAFKVTNKVQLGLFHLFSYLCVTEIIPSIIIFKILYY
jgi:Domain of unknown function (DUF4271)